MRRQDRAGFGCELDIRWGCAPGKGGPAEKQGGESDHKSHRIETIEKTAGIGLSHHRCLSHRGAGATRQEPGRRRAMAAATPAGQWDGDASQLIEIAAFAVANPWQVQKGRRKNRAVLSCCCDPSGSLSNLRLEIPFSVVALRAA